MVTAVLIAVAVAGIVVLVRPCSFGVSVSVRGWLDECGLAGIPLGAVALTVIVIALVVSGVVAVLLPIPALAPLAGVAGIAIPVAVLDASRTRRRAVAESTWPDTIDAIRMAIRSGVPLHDALATAESQVPREWRASWNRAVVDLARGTSVSDALIALRSERAEPIADRVCETIIIAEEMGGTELPRVLEELARSVREDVRLRREATARQSWVRHAARLGVVAPWAVVVMLGSRIDNREAFASPAGTALLVGCAGATVVAYIVMTALGRLPESARWVSDD